MFGSMPHFFAEDLIGTAAALLLGVPLILLPGYGLGWSLDLFGFRTLSPNTRWSLAPGLALSIAPILLYLAFRLVSAPAMWILAALFCGLGIWACAKSDSRPDLRSIPFAVKIIVPTWLILATCLTLDVAIANRLYPSNVIIDTSFRSQVISSLANSSHLPAESYFFYPGHPVPLRYHYIYFLIPTTMVQITRYWLTSSMALFGLVLWTGIAFFGVVDALIRFFWQPTDVRRITSISLALLGVGGLDILFSGTEMLWRALHHEFIFTSPDVGLWNGWGSSFSWLSTSLWSPHHLGGLMAGSLGSLALWHSRDSRIATRWTHAIAAACAFATLAGTSVYVCAIFAIFLLLLVIELFLNAPRYLAPILTAGLVSALLILPFFLDVKPAPGAPAFFAFQTRPFVPITSLFHFLDVPSQLVWNLGYFLALPAGYLAGFGVFFLGGIWWLYARRHHAPELTYRDHMIVGLGAVSLIVPSFVWSGMEISNDLGYRGVLPAQLLLLLCTAQCINTSRRRTSPDAPSDNGTNSLPNTYSRAAIQSRPLRHLMVAFLILGIATNLLEMVILRGGIGTTAQHTIQVGDMFRPDTSAERLYALRDAYTWIRKNTPRTAVIQENPLPWQMIALGQYSERRTIVYGSNPSYMVGEDHRPYLSLAQQTYALFSSPLLPPELDQKCSSLISDYLVVQKGDRVWRHDVIGSNTQVLPGEMVKIIRCGQIHTRH